MPPAINPSKYIGLTFGRLTVISLALKKRHPGIGRKAGWTYIYECLCECANTTQADIKNLKYGHVKSCGCYRVEHTRKMRTKHGEASEGAKTPEWIAWHGMVARCYQPSSSGY